MKLIPNICISSSGGEKKIFSLLQKKDCLEGCIGLHSLNLASHVSNAEGEADFVLLIPNKGILVIEVKDHESVKFEQGKWYLGRDKPLVGGPIKQAREAMYSILEYIRSKIPEASRVPISYCVWFTRTEFNADEHESIEWESFQFLDVRNLDNVQQSINEVMNHSIRHLKSKPTTQHVLPSSLTFDLTEKIVGHLRPRFETILGESTLRKIRRDEMTRLIEDQFTAIDGMEENPRVIISGPAGTGKTLLALEKARRIQLQGKKVAYLCFNTFLQIDVASKNLDLEVWNISKLIMKLSNTESRNASNIQEIESKDPKNFPIEEIYDALIIDEAQDIFASRYFPWLDAILKGGLKNGSWFAFGDFQSQNLYNNPFESDEIEKYCDSYFRFLLRHNCRNLPNIGYLTYTLVPNAPKWTSFRRNDDGVDPMVRFTGGAADLTKELDQAVEYLRMQKFSLSDIVVLTPSKIACPSETFSKSLFADRLIPWTLGASGKIRFSTIHAFKGLESQCIILMELYDLIGNSDAQFLKYTALTRATDRLFIIADIDSQRVLEAL